MRKVEIWEFEKLLLLGEDSLRFQGSPSMCGEYCSHMSSANQTSACTYSAEIQSFVEQLEIRFES